MLTVGLDAVEDASSEALSHDFFEAVPFLADFFFFFFLGGAGPRSTLGLGIGPSPVCCVSDGG
jgi:hypothetical protein